jgi:hypothetical protein
MVEYPIKIDVEYEEKASRLEALIIRWLYSIFLYIVIVVWGLVAGILLVIHWLYILILGKRDQSIHGFVSGFFMFSSRVTGYIYLLTDNRPQISGGDESEVKFPIKLKVDFEKSASRLEVLIIRWLYGIVLGIVAEIWGFIASIVLFFQWLYILILGKRNQSMHDFVAGYFRFYTRMVGYLYLLTDQRPPISGK